MHTQDSSILNQFVDLTLQMTSGNSHSETSGFSLINLNDIIHQIQNPTDLTAYQPDENGKLRQAKSNCPWFLPSDCAISKQKNAVELHNNYTCLVADVDDGNSDLEAIEGDLKSNGIDSYYIYSTMSSKPTDKRWRVVVPISQTIDLDHWQALQAALVVALAGDDCTSRSQQISYLPALSVFNKDCYQFKIEHGQPLDVFESYFAEQAALLAAEQAQEMREQETKTKAAQPKSLSLTDGQISPIDAFNQANDWHSLLSQYGFKKRGKKWLHPDSTSGIAGVFISYRDDQAGRYVSSHSSDPLSGYSRDKFDLYCQFEHGGDFEAALKQVGDSYQNQDGLSINRHNQRAHMAANDDQAVKYEQQTWESLTSNAEKSEQMEWEEPQPFNVNLRPVELFDVDAMLPKQVRDYVSDYAYRMDKAPIDFAAISVIISAGALIGGAAEIQPKKLDTGWRLVPTLWGGALGQPSTKKTPSLACGRRLIEHAQKAVIDKLNAEKLDIYELEVELAEELEDEAKQKAKEALAAGDKQKALEIKRQAKSQAPQAPSLRNVVINDSTSEALAMRMEKNPLGVLVFRDELSAWLLNMDRADRQHERGFYLEAFNGFGSYSQERVTRKNIELERVIASIMGGIQPAKITPLLAGKDNGTGDDGLLERLLQMMVFPDFHGMTYVDQAPNVMAEMTAKSVFEALAYLGELESPLLCRFDDEAQDLWTEYASNMVKREKSAASKLQSMLGKYTALCAKLALVFHLLEECGSTLTGERPEPSAMIAKHHLERAIKWMTYLESHALRILSFFSVEQDLAPAKTLAERLDKLYPMFTKASLNSCNWKGLQSIDSREKAIAALLERGYIKEIVTPAQNGRGKPKVQYFVHPKFSS
ncbi:DUF3987 domain-containing protein [Vibrio fluvialis]|nr:DUF3987 domain-containing protein [Vibrio fluvialis]MBY8103931.1 DUF3987 domain-containing protein [Vibrio fluvialis]